jgi:hypothetical protein
LFEGGVSKQRDWARVFELVDLRRKVANTEARREHLLETAMTADQAKALMGCLLEVLLRELPRGAVARVVTGVNELLRERLSGTRSAPVAPPALLAATTGENGTDNGTTEP